MCLGLGTPPRGCGSHARKEVTRSSINRRLELLKTRVMPSSEERRALIIQFVSETGEVVGIMPVVLQIRVRLERS